MLVKENLDRKKKIKKNLKLYYITVVLKLDLLLNGFKSSKKQRKGSLNDSQNLEEIFAEGLSSPDCNACTQAAIRFSQRSTEFTIVPK